MSAEERALLEAFVVENRDLERLEALLAQFNIFEALGAVRQELRHSDFMAFLMDPSQNHGLGDAFLKRFLKRILIDTDDPPLSPVEIDVADLRAATVIREWQNIDILVRDEASKLVCAVENKIGAREHSKQLQRYRQIITREHPQPSFRHVFIYLTPEGDTPSDEAYIPLSYATIAQLVDDVREFHASTLGPDVSTLMAHYTAMLRRHIVSESEVATLCRQIYNRHKQALDLILEHRPDLQWDLAQIIGELIEERDDLVGDHSSKGYIRFAVSDWDDFPAQRSGQGWTRSRRVLLFEFQNAPVFLTLRLIIGPGPDVLRQAIFQVTADHSRVFRGGSKRLYRKWTTVHVRRFLTERDYEDTELDTLIEKVQAQWQKFISQDLPAIKDAFAGMTWPEIPEVPAA